jgi:molecular chaperone DnaJ
MQDPYKILGLSNSASDDEVTKAYRRLVKKYHPDLHPGDKESERKMREINDAYDRIKKGDVNTNTNTNAGNNNTGNRNSYNGYNYYSSYNRTYNAENLYSTARHFVNIGSYRTAIRILSEIKNKTAEWYYLSSISNYYINNRIIALNHARIAVQMEPNNNNYKKLLQQIEGQANEYNETSQNYGRNIDTQGLCFWCCAIEMFLRCCCNTGC